MGLEQDYTDALAKLEANNEQFSAFLSGAVDETVPVEQGAPIPTIRNFLRSIGFDAEALLDSAWDVSSNTPDLSAIAYTTPKYFVVTSEGASNLTGINVDWKLGDEALFLDNVWYRIPKFSGFGTNAVYQDETALFAAVPNFVGELEVNSETLTATNDPLSALTMSTGTALNSRSKTFREIEDGRYASKTNNATLNDVKRNDAIVILSFWQSKGQGRISITPEYTSEDVAPANLLQVNRGFVSPNYTATYGGAWSSFIPAVLPLQWFQRSVVELPDKEVGGAFAAGREIAFEHSDTDIILVPCNWGGTGFSENEWGVGNRLSEDAIADVRETLKRARKVYDNVTFGGIIGNGGEDDSYSQAAADAFEAELVAQIVEFRTRIGEGGDWPVIIHDMVPEFVAARGNPGAVVRAALANIGTTSPGAHFVDASARTGQTPDNIHWDAEASRADGKAAGELFNSVFTASGVIRDTTEPGVIFELGKVGGIAVDTANGDEPIEIQGNSPQLGDIGAVYFTGQGAYRPKQRYPQGSWTTQCFFRLARLGFNNNFFSGYSGPGAGQVPGESPNVQILLASSNTIQISDNQGVYPTLESAVISSAIFGIWKEFTVTYDSKTGTMKAYIDKDEIDSISGLPAKTVGATRVQIGGFQSGTYANMEMAHVRMLDGALSAAQIADRFDLVEPTLNGPASDPSDLAEAWGFNGNLNGVNGTVLTQPVGPAIGYDNGDAALFTGAEELDAGDLIPLTGSYTKYVRFRSTSATTQDIFSGGSTSSNLRISSSGVAQARSNSSLPFPRVSGGSNLADGNFHNLVHVFNADTNTSQLWVDQACVALGADAPSNSANVRIGALNGGSRFIGSLDQLRLWGRALTPNEIKNIAFS